jgi:uncharacterized protein
MADEQIPLNVLGEPLQSCCMDPRTGFYRDGYCQTGDDDLGSHLVCAEMTEEFLAFSKKQGNDLSTPRPEFSFPGLKAGDRWCVCALRWVESYEAKQAPKILLSATHQTMLDIVPLEVLVKYALDVS